MCVVEKMHRLLDIIRASSCTLKKSNPGGGVVGAQEHNDS